MGFFPDQADAGQEGSLGAVQDGSMPVPASRRLQRLGAGSVFTSGLSGKEFALFDRVGVRPLAQVMGASVMHVGPSYLPSLAPSIDQSAPPGQGYDEPTFAQRANYKWRQELTCELPGLTRAWREAQRRALDRLMEEALAVRADAVVAVTLQRAEHDRENGQLELAIMGTAVTTPGSEGKNLPVLTDLSGQDYWRLLRSGHEPAGLVLATSVWFASPAGVTRLQRLRTVTEPQELTELTWAFYRARASVRDRLHSGVQAAAGDGLVGADFSHTLHRDEFHAERSVNRGSPTGWQRGGLGLPVYSSNEGEAARAGWVITMHAAGTAIRRTRELNDRGPGFVINLNDQ